MKQITDSIYKQISSSTPFKVIQTLTDCLELYRNKYGDPVLLIISNPKKDTIYCKIGGGSCNESVATVKAFEWLGYAPCDIKWNIENGCQQVISPSYRVGGNFYRIFKKDILKLRKAKK